MEPAKVVVQDQGKGIAYGVRGYEPRADTGVIVGSWADNIRHIKLFKPISDNGKMFGKYKRFVIEPLVNRCGALLAHDVEHPDQVFGWICGEIVRDRYILHFIYVRNVFRQFGIGTALMKFAFPLFKKKAIIVSHPGRSTPYLIDRWKLEVNPYIVDMVSNGY